MLLLRRRRFSKCTLRWQIFKIIVHKLLSTLVTLQLWRWGGATLTIFQAVSSHNSKCCEEFTKQKHTRSRRHPLSLSFSARLAVISRDTYLQAGRSAARLCWCVFMLTKSAFHPSAHQGHHVGSPFSLWSNASRKKTTQKICPRSQISLCSVRALISGQLADTLKFRRRPTAFLRRWLSSRLIYNAAAASAAFPDSGRRSQLELINSLRATRLRESCGRS